HARTAAGASQDDFRYLRAHRVVLVCRQRNRRQDADDRDHDHQFDEGETLLDGTLHELSPENGGVRRPMQRTPHATTDSTFIVTCGPERDTNGHHSPQRPPETRPSRRFPALRVTSCRSAQPWARVCPGSRLMVWPAASAEIRCGEPSRPISDITASISPGLMWVMSTSTLPARFFSS